MITLEIQAIKTAGLFEHPILTSRDLTHDQKTTNYTSLFPSQILYACQIWWHTSKSNQAPYHRVQSSTYSYLCW